ncbi:NAD(P)/FAD-dependent oxidoreductase [Brevibacillus migulae]|uniref:NAD(P)/FAD-dependent oxidoreductase n=1 Tax=Brevibacillus migulae TaxID=1644114 RepID=UPI00106E52B2|nr:FAD-dependent oxidoreductase [Brevibacillus migulae]
MNLHNGTYYWLETLPHPPVYPRLAQDISCDILIIGAGIAGAQCAYWLRDSGLNVVLVEKNRVGSGGTSANTAFIQHAGEKMAHQLVNSFGEELAFRHLRLCKEAIDHLEQAAAQMSIDSSFARRSSLYTASQPNDVEKLEKDYKLLRDLGFAIDFLTEDEIAARYPFRRHAALYCRDDAELNPLAYTHGLIALAAGTGTHVYEQTRVTGKHYEKDAVIYRTDTGHTIRAKHVILAAGYENMRIKAEKNAMLIATYATVTTPVAESLLRQHWHERSLIWETADDYIYMRTTPDNRVIIGGLDERVYHINRNDALRLHKSEKLIQEFNKLFPGIAVQAEYAAAAYYGGTHDGLPIIGMYTDFPRCTFFDSYGDNGIVYSMVLSKIVRDVLVNGESADLDLYRQDRPLLKNKQPILV